MRIAEVPSRIFGLSLITRDPHLSNVSWMSARRSFFATMLPMTVLRRPPDAPHDSADRAGHEAATGWVFAGRAVYASRGARSLATDSQQLCSPAASRWKARALSPATSPVNIAPATERRSLHLKIRVAMPEDNIILL